MLIEDKQNSKIDIQDSDASHDTSDVITKALQKLGFEVLHMGGSKNLSAGDTENLKGIIIGPEINTIDALEIMANISSPPHIEYTPFLRQIPIIIYLSDNKSLYDYDSISSYNIFFLNSPILLHQLVSKIKVLLPNLIEEKSKSTHFVRYKDLSLNIKTQKVNRGHKSALLQSTEYKILELFMKYPNVVFPRNEIISYVWDKDMVTSISPRTVDVHINRLRNILKSKLNIDDAVRTVRSQGYYLSTDITSFNSHMAI